MQKPRPHKEIWLLSPLPIFQGWCRFVAARAYNFWRYRASRFGIMGAYMGYNTLNVPMEYWAYAHWGS